MLVTNSAMVTDKTIKSKLGKIPKSIFTNQEYITILDTLNTILIDRKINDNINYYIADLDNMLKMRVLELHQNNTASTLVTINLKDFKQSLLTKLNQLSTDASNMIEVNEDNIDLIDNIKLNNNLYYSELDNVNMNFMYLLYELKEKNIITMLNDYTISNLEAYIHDMSLSYNDDIAIPEDNFIYNNKIYLYNINNEKSLFSYLYSEMLDLVNTYTSGYNIILKLQLSLNYDIIDYFIINNNNYINSKIFYYSYTFGDLNNTVHKNMLFKDGIQTIIPDYLLTDYTQTHDIVLTFDIKNMDLTYLIDVLNENIRTILEQSIELFYPDFKVYNSNVMKPICNINISDLNIVDITYYNSKNILNTENIKVSKYCTEDDIYNIIIPTTIINK